MLTWVKEAHDFRKRRDFFSAYNEEIMENPLHLQQHEVLADFSLRISINQLYKQLPTGESGVQILHREMVVLTFSSNHCTKFLPAKEF